MESPNFDERLEAMRQQLELVSHMQQENEQHIAKLTATVEKHEREWERFRRTMRAALAEWFAGNGDEGEAE